MANATVLIEAILPRAPHRRIAWRTPHGAARALAIAAAALKHPGLLLVVAADTHGAHALEVELSACLPSDLPVLHFPDWETLPYDLFAPHSEIVSQRIATLYRLPSIARGVLVVPVSTLMQRVAPRRYIGGSALMLEVGQRLDLEAEKRRLDAAGYRHVPQVLESGDYATRGALLDLFPPGSAEPYRIELFDTQIDSIRTFDPETQRSLAKVMQVQLLPAREFPLDAASVRAFRHTLAERFAIDLRRSPLYQDLREGGTPAGIEYYLPLFFEATETLFDYLAPDTLAVVDQGALDAAGVFWQSTAARHEQRRHDVERPVLAPEELFLPPEQLRAALNRVPRIELHASEPDIPLLDLGDTPAPMLPPIVKGEEAGSHFRRWFEAADFRALLAVDSPGRREALLDTLRGQGLEPTVSGSIDAFVASGVRLSILVAPFERGYTLHASGYALLTERELQPDHAPQSRRRRRSVRDPDTIVRDLAELALGAPVVHEDHGVGRYRGLTRLDLGQGEGEFLAIEYAKGDKLYVPVTQLHLVGRYTGTAPELAPLHSLGGEAWDKAKRKAAERVHDVAAELLELYAKRAARGGTEITCESAMFEQFVAGFPFEETPDQLSAIEAVVADLAAPRPMDRVVCGDVGFGKTEVALRAAFVAAAGGRQVVLLVPTTLLAEQHYRNFADRFADWPIRIELLSRFRSPKEVQSLLKRLEDGTVDIVVGTHRLLQADVRFQRLGLVIVDEEHRFGVRHKEQLRKLRAEVDLLTLTATPIPRTLNMAMAGLRDLSIIATPPAHRLAVETFVTEWDTAQIREAIQRELARGGQVYVLHNDVASIQRAAIELGAIVPEARVRVAHGQMPERELEQVMLDFYRQRFNVLVCSTIIESGIDVPSANTIIIERADKFGLAQLHQLRGRVGRSHHRAYCYLVVPEMRALSADAKKRLEAIATLQDLGAGFALATHDLEIRGAGELLGEEQSGQIQEIGYSLYTELLERAVRALKEGRMPGLDDERERRAEVELHVPALLPETYLGDVHTRLVMYKRIATAVDSERLQDLMAELVDRFGNLPEQTRNLFQIAELRLSAEKLGIRKLELGAAGGRITFLPKPKVEPITVIRLVQREPKVYALDGQDKLKVRLTLPGATERIATAKELLMRLSGRSPK